MKCIICHGEDIQVTDVREVLDMVNDIVYVPIRIPVCRTCGERYYDRQTMRFLEKVERKLKSQEADLEEIGRVLTFG
jgi:YgiT-type zinc finger domain-containing protein